MKRCLFIFLAATLFAGNSFGQEEENVSPEEHYQLADKLFSNEKCKDALKHINKTIAAKPNDEAYALRAAIHECNGDINAAITDYSVLIYNHPEDAEYLFSRGSLLYSAERYEKAIEDMRRSLQFPVNETNKVFYKIEPGNKGISGLSTLSTMQAEIYNYLGLSFHKLSKYDSALENFGRAISLSQNPQFYNNRALVYEEKDQSENAISDYEEALKLNPYDQVAIYNLMNLYGKIEDFEKQKMIIDQISGNEKLPEVYIYKGVAAYRTGDYRTAVAQYDSAILQNADNEETYLFRGQAYEKLKEFDRAKSDFLAAIDIDPQFPGAYFSLGNLYYRTHKLDSSIFYYDLAILYDPDYANAYMNRGTAYLRKKEVEKACQDLDVAQQKGLEEAAKLYNRECLDQ